MNALAPWIVLAATIWLGLELVKRCGDAMRAGEPVAALCYGLALLGASKSGWWFVRLMGWVVA